MPTFITVSFVFDMICIVLLIGLALYHAYKGLAATILQLFGTAFSAIGAYWGSSQIAPWLFDRFAKDYFTKKISESVVNADVSSLGEYAGELIGFVPSEIRTPIIQMFTQNLSQGLAGNATVVAQVIVDDVLEPMLVSTISVFTFFVIFTVLRILIGMLVGMLEGVNGIPMLGKVNRGLGFAIGLLAGAIDVYLILCAVWGLILVTNGKISVLTMEALGDSFLLTMFQQCNPFM